MLGLAPPRRRWWWTFGVPPISRRRASSSYLPFIAPRTRSSSGEGLAQRTRRSSCTAFMGVRSAKASPRRCAPQASMQSTCRTASTAGSTRVSRRTGRSGATPGKWVTRERPKIDRIACPWLIRRFIDPQAEFIYVPTKDVLDGRQRDRRNALRHRRRRIHPRRRALLVRYHPAHLRHQGSGSRPSGRRSSEAPTRRVTI